MQKRLSIKQDGKTSNDSEKVIKNPSSPKPKSALQNSDKNPAAVYLGRLGGLKGGKARALKLSNKERSNIARKAALARWSKSRD
jgi:hypothetical protein